MPREIKSQWEFGELFPSTVTRKVLSVSELTLQVKRLLEQHVGAVWVTGEISNLRVQPSGHAYFTLKDAGAQLACVLFRGEAVANRDALQEGRKVNLHGDVTVYEARGQYQLRVTEIELEGIGALQAAFERLKQKLAAEGLFAEERKRPLPRFPRRIGVVTSLKAAAFRDVLHVIERRFAGLETILAACRVQGEGAAVEISDAIKLLNDYSARAKKLDLILVTRGGGSLEDLWAFNEDVVARAIFESALPVVSGVGHEIDFTISDFVADLRAATPSAAAEIITEGYVASREFVLDAAATLRRSIRRRLETERETTQQMFARLARVHPRRWLDQQAQRLDDLWGNLHRETRHGVREQLNAWHAVRQRLLRLRPQQQLEQRRETLARARRRLGELGRRQWQEWQHRFSSLETRLRLLGPEQVLARGYSITMDAANGAVIRDARKVKAGQKLRTKLHKGEVRSVAES
ncbi:MAG TPA: exodeoxyribonuclease VII large subunit [Verrucomicrobiae bacterium]|jgi:exodeoxyribonuclease VII large subunit